MCLCWALWGVGDDEAQGTVYRILYIHVPSAFTAFLCCLFLFLISVLHLSDLDKKIPFSFVRNRQLPQAIAETGCMFTVFTLVTGSVWGKSTWGTWWTWDARLTTTFILALLYGGYLLLWHALNNQVGYRRKVCAILAVLIFADVPLIYKSVSWWRTLHQPVSLMREGGAPMSPEILSLLWISIGVMCAFGVWLMAERAVNLQLKAEFTERLYRDF
jgi:heme exporter protein C